MLVTSKRLRKAQNVRPSQVMDDSDMWELIDQVSATKHNMKAWRERTRSSSDVTLTVSYPNNPNAPHMWNWQFMASKAFPRG